MGMYVNPGNESFRSDSGAEIYIDKTGLLKELNRDIGTPHRCFAVSRARRFGKSMAAGMIDAYYSVGCDSRELFAPFEIAGDADFETHLNKYNVLHFDVSSFWNESEHTGDAVQYINEILLDDFRREFPDMPGEVRTVATALREAFLHTGRRFVIIIDEWDCIIRDAKNEQELILSYLKYLRGFFKTEEAKRFLALGYITGILPIKQLEGESAMNNFTEYTMVSPKSLATYFGFTEEEAEGICRRYGCDMEPIRRWYDGYRMELPPERAGEAPKQIHIYNPNSLVQAFRLRHLESYWKNTGAFRGLNAYITRNEAGLKDTVVRMLAGEECPVNTSTFQNDLTSFKKKDDVLTALIHMGYLGYDAATGCAFIPNEEVRDVFNGAIEVGDWADIQDALDHADELLEASWAGNAERVAEFIDKSHQDYASIIRYHDENALACAIMMSYYTARAHYVIRRELPSGRGFADIAFLPKEGQGVPAMVVELKWNRSARAAIKQILDKDYAGFLSDYMGRGGEVLLVGINYSKKTGRHSCRIRRA